MTKPRDPNQVEYQPPGSTEWRPVESPQKVQQRSRDLARERARRLLVEGEEVARAVLRRSRQQAKEQDRSEAEISEFERDMSAAMGNFERMVAAGARKLRFDAKDTFRDLKNKK